MHGPIFFVVAAFPHRRRRRLEIYVETLEELGVELRPLVACGIWARVPRLTCAYSFVGLLLLFFRANVSLLISAVSAPPEEKAPPQVRVSPTLSWRTDAWTDDGDTDEDVDDDDPGAASGWGMAPARPPCTREALTLGAEAPSQGLRRVRVHHLPWALATALAALLARRLREDVRERTPAAPRSARRRTRGTRRRGTAAPRASRARSSCPCCSSAARKSPPVKNRTRGDPSFSGSPTGRRKRALCVFGLLGLRGLPMLVFTCELELDGQRGAPFWLAARPSS